MSIQIKREIISQVPLFDLEGDLRTAINFLIHLETSAMENGYSGLVLTAGESGGEWTLDFSGARPETDKERRRREVAAKKLKASVAASRANRQTRERKEYLRLKKKYDKGI